jgi:hypothetical protein
MQPKKNQGKIVSKILRYRIQPPQPPPLKHPRSTKKMPSMTAEQISTKLEKNNIF